jgi:anti-sigma B factor antagonist
VVVLFDVERTTVFDAPVLRVVGELDLTTAPLLAKAADAELVLSPATLFVDLTPTTFLDSSGARTLAQLARRSRTEGVALQVVCPRGNSAVRLVVDLLELRSVVPITEVLPHRPTGIAGGEDRP